MSAFFMLENKVTLKVNGIDYSGWTSVSIITSLQSFYRTFSLESSRRVSSEGIFGVEIRTCDEVEVFIGEDKVITGYVTKVDVSYNASSLHIRIQGAGKPWIMFSSALPYTAPKAYENTSITETLKRIASFFGLTFHSTILLTDKTTVSFSADESIISKIQDILKRKNILLTEDEFGRLVLTSPGALGQASSYLKSGENILSGKTSDNAENYYSEYLVYGQGTNPDSLRPVTDNQLMGKATGSHKIVRVLAKKQTGNALQSDLDVRANLLKNYSEATAVTRSYIVKSWRQDNGELWRPNQIVKVMDSIFNEYSGLLVESVTYSLNSNGTVCQLNLVPLSALGFVDLSSTEEKVKKASNLKLTSVNTTDAKWTDT